MIDSSAVKLDEITVLYCEDEEELRRITGDVLKNFTKKVYLASDGRKGLNLFKEHQEDIDLIITDVNMPEMTGLEMAEQIKAINSNIPIIVATAFSNSNYLLDAINLGIDRYILKPINIHKLFEVIKQSLYYHELQDLYKDNLTHLGNRNALLKKLKTLNSSIIALLDIDDFSILNELYGEEVGDVILVQFVEKLYEFFSKDKFTVYRVGPDKFALLPFDLEMDQNHLQQLCIDFEKYLEKHPVHYEEHTINFEFCAAIATTSDNRTFETAQRVLNIAKKKFLKTMQYDPDIHDTHKNFKENLVWIKKLKDGFHNGNLRAYFQPIVNAKTKEIYKYESLIRYIDDDGTVYPPNQFLPLAKKAKLYPAITQLMLNECINFIKVKKSIVTVNISFEDMKNKLTTKFIYKLLEDNKDIASNLHFELLETEEIEDYDLVKKFIHKIQEYGCKIGVDDFGAGYSNFNMLVALQVDFVKIDGSLINSIDTDKNQEIIVKTIAQYAQSTNIDTVAEFVSRESIYHTIYNLGINYAQGYYFSEPISLDKV